MGRLRAPRLHRLPAGMVPGAAAHRHHARPPGAVRPAPRLGRQHPQPDTAGAGAAERCTDARAAGGLRTRPASGRHGRRSWLAPTACPSTRSRRCGPWSRKAVWNGSMAHTTRSTIWASSPCPTSAQPHRIASGRIGTARPSLAPGRRGPGPVLHAAGLAAVGGNRCRFGSSSPAPPGPAGAARPRGRPPLAGARPVPLRPVAHPGGRLRHARPARPAEPPPGRGRGFYESLGDDELAGALASHYLAAQAASEPGPEADAVAPGPAGPQRRRGTGRDPGCPRSGRRLSRSARASRRTRPTARRSSTGQQRPRASRHGPSRSTPRVPSMHIDSLAIQSPRSLPPDDLGSR